MKNFVYTVLKYIGRLSFCHIPSISCRHVCMSDRNRKKNRIDCYMFDLRRKNNFKKVQIVAPYQQKKICWIIFLTGAIFPKCEREIKT